ncbi:MAG: PQQ-binding-like beta-propeller repeat protein [Thermoplasmatales archaeon]|nr:PQQ-binding-like beta-propeller repeat protein [Thermoplasmatales archaeon]
MSKNILIVGIISLFFVSALAPMTFGIDIVSKEKSAIKPFDRHLYPEYYDSYNTEEISSFIEYQNYDVSTNYENSKSKESNPGMTTTQLLDGPIDSPWPMYCHDTCHTGRSPYSTSENTGYEKWRFNTGCVWGSPVIDNDGIIYIGAIDLFAIYSNGTLKWRYDTKGFIESAAAIDDNGVLYVGSIWAHPNYLYAIYTSNGTLKWKFKVDNHIFSSPAIGDDGSIYFGSEDDYIYALYPNGTLKWKYLTSVAVLSSPAIGEDGTIYCGSYDTYLYALYPNNGTVKWKYKTGHWIRTSPCIGDDGTIYVVSLDNYLHAVYPNGTRKWRTDVGAGTSPTIGQDGTIYCGYSKLYAVNPTDGSVKWTFDVGGTMRGGTPCNSIDGTIYVGTSDGGELISINSDGTLKWRKNIGEGVESAPCIGEDGTVYIGGGGDDGRLFAFGYPGPNPLTPDIDGPTSGKPGTSYTYTFTSIDPDEDQVSYYIDWNDGDITDWTDFQPSGNPYSESHTWTTKGTYVVRAKAKDTEGYESDWGTLTVTMPRNRAYSNTLVLRLLERFPLLERFLTLLIK